MNSIKLIATIIIMFVGASVHAAAQTLPPTIDVQRHALEYARFDVAEIASWHKRARVAALVPRIQFDIGKRLRNNINVGVQDNIYVGSGGVVVGPEEGDYSNVQTNDLTVGVRAVWEFGEAVFSPKSLAISAETRRAAKDRNLLLAEVNRHYFNVAGFADEARIMWKSPAAEKKPKFVELKVFQRRTSCRESAAQLDALTGGWFTRSLAAPDAICRGHR